MIFRQITLTAAMLLLAFCSTALAHDMWATFEDVEVGKPLTAAIGYGHSFPQTEAIPADEVELFKPIRAIGPTGELTMKPGTDNFKAVSQENLVKGTYLVITDVTPVFWTKTPDGWSRKPRNEEPQALSCGMYIENAKGIVNVDGSIETELIGKPVGLPLEIVPLANPATIKPGQRLQLQVLFEGKPLARAKVAGRFAGFAQNASPSANAFYDTAGRDGIVNFVPLKSGEWIVTVRNVRPYPEEGKCDKEDFGTSLFFTIED